MSRQMKLVFSAVLSYVIQDISLKVKPRRSSLAKRKTGVECFLIRQAARAVKCLNIYLIIMPGTFVTHLKSSQALLTE